MFLVGADQGIKTKLISTDQCTFSDT